MNKQEAIEIIEQSTIKIPKRVKVISKADNVLVETGFIDYVPLDVVVNMIDQIHEPQKIVVPKFVAKWLEDMKNAKIEFFEAQSNCMPDEFDDWYYNHADDLLRAWLDGYEIEKEQLYVVTDGNKLYLKKFEELNAVIIIDDVVGATDYAQHFVDKIKAQKAADELGWVVKEVEDER
ncbi:TPA: DUF1642 domain-containing protein [Streptococcus suis]|nr:DUF1642 domain-containing protein [Streptococcus suis]HEL1808985.1 DUF1642 domain-containing protein [Streptococcus suis]HEL1810272.1 DUF1642 domain-containing protein [Streptococcus suis]